MELVQGTSLLSFLKSKPYRKIDESDCKSIFSQIMKGINYLHTKSICHRDIKLENIIIDDKHNIKLIDFGFGATGIKSKLLNFFCGTPSYMPPEIVLKKDYIGSNADIWSIGILLFTLLCGSFPFRGLSEKELYSKIIKGSFSIPDHISCEAKNLIQKILIVNPVNRINSRDVIFIIYI
jgi:serine/threonine protein kinase